MLDKIAEEQVKLLRELGRVGKEQKLLEERDPNNVLPNTRSQQKFLERQGDSLLQRLVKVTVGGKLNTPQSLKNQRPVKLKLVK